MNRRVVSGTWRGQTGGVERGGGGDRRLSPQTQEQRRPVSSPAGERSDKQEGQSGCLWGAGRGRAKAGSYFLLGRYWQCSVGPEGEQRGQDGPVQRPVAAPTLSRKRIKWQQPHEYIIAGALREHVQEVIL